MKNLKLLHYGILFSLFVVLTFGCNVRKSMEKPFLIIGKSIIEKKGSDEIWRVGYHYQDKNGRRAYFQIREDKYDIGDTIN